MQEVRSSNLLSSTWSDAKFEQIEQRVQQQSTATAARWAAVRVFGSGTVRCGGLVAGLCGVAVLSGRELGKSAFSWVCDTCRLVTTPASRKAVSLATVAAFAGGCRSQSGYLKICFRHPYRAPAHAACAGRARGLGASRRMAPVSQCSAPFRALDRAVAQSGAGAQQLGAGPLELGPPRRRRDHQLIELARVVLALALGALPATRSTRPARDPASAASRSFEIPAVGATASLQAERRA